MKILIPKERGPYEARVATSPEVVKKLITMGCQVYVEKGAGEGASFLDEHFKEVGARIVTLDDEVCQNIHIVFKVQRPSSGELKKYPPKTILIGLLDVLAHRKDAELYAKAHLSAFSLDLMPRITRAQSMDVLSSQSNLAGYRAVIEAAWLYNRALPMMMTAAGTVFPAKVLVVGAGVAGLQAIATARRLGAIVFGYDVRRDVKEQVESLGATFIDVELRTDLSTSGGYAQEMSEDARRHQEDRLLSVVQGIHIIITTALIPGKEAPKVISEEMLKRMKPGSLVIDLASERGGNCFGSASEKEVVIHGVRVLGASYLASRVASHASELYARNMLNFFKLIYDEKTKKIMLNRDDEIIRATLVAHEGVITRKDLDDGASKIKEPAHPQPKNRKT